MRIRASIAAAFVLLSVLCLDGATFAQDSPPPTVTGSSTLSASTPWIPTCIDCPKRFDPPGDHYLAVDAQGRAHLAYGGDALYYARQDGGQWQIETVDPAPGVGSAASLAIDSSGQPQIAYYDAANQAIRFAYLTDGGWQTQAVENNAKPALGLAATPGGATAIAYLTTPYEDGRMVAAVSAGYWDGTNWRVRTIGNASFNYPSIALAVSPKDGRISIAYVNDGEFLVYAHDGGSSMEFLPPVAESFYGEELSLAVDRNGMPHIMYTQVGRLYYARYEGAGWITELVDEARHFQSVSLRLDENDQPHFVGHNPYADRLNEGLPPLSAYAWHGWRDAGGWHFDAIETQGSNPDLAWGLDGRLRVAYLKGEETLELAESGPDGGWASETVDREEALSGPISLAIDRQGRPQVAYLGHALYRAAPAPGGWGREAVFSSAGSQTLAVDSLGQPHMAALEAYRPPPWQPQPWNYRLWYAYRQGGEWHRTAVDDEAGHMPVIVVDGKDRVHLAYIYAHPEAMDQELIYLVDGRVDRVAKTHAFRSLSMAVDSQANPLIVDMNENYRITYRSFDSSTWHAEPVGPAPEMPRSDAELALDGGGRPAVAYTESLPGLATSVLFAVRTPAAWTVETVLQEDFGPDYVAGMGVGEEIRLAFDAADRPHLVFARDGRLQHGWRTTAGWQFKVIDPAAVPAAFDLAAGPDGRLLVAYVDALANDARLVALQPGPGLLYLPVILR